jgi:putative PIN family toxin of toxin-antitoxin system
MDGLTRRSRRYARNMVSVVLDTVIFVRCLLNPGSVWGRLVFDHAADYRLVVSELVRNEIVRVVSRRELTGKYRFVAGRGKAVALARLDEATVVEVTDIPRVSRDATDDKFLATAKAAQADYLVTEDADLLVLREYEGTRIIDAAAFLRWLEGGNGNS